MFSYRKRSYGMTGGQAKKQNVSGAFKPPRSVSIGPIARQAQRVGGRGSSATELKFIDTATTTSLTVGSAAFTSPAAATLLNGCVSGSTATTRIGRKILMKSLLLRCVFTCGSTAVGCTPVRVLVVYDKQANGAYPAVTDVLLASEFNSPNNLSNRDRFVTLIDQFCDPISVNNTATVCKVFYKKLDLETMFNTGVVGDVTDMTSGSIVVMFAQTGKQTVAAPVIDWRCRIRFDDN